MAVDPRIELAKIYIAFFDRAPDPVGLAFWVGEYQKAVDAGSDPFNILFDISNSFAISDEAQAFYPQLGATDLSDINSFIFDAYQNLFGRAPDAEGLVYWTGRVQEELAAGRPVGSILVDLQSGAQNSPVGADLATLNNKVTVGLNYVDQFTASGAEWTAADDLAGSKSVVSEVNGTPQSVTAANDKIVAIVEEQTGPTEPPVDPTDPGENPSNPGGGGPVNPPAAETFTVSKSFDNLALGANQAGDLFVGLGNPASGFARTNIVGSNSTTIEIGLDARYRGDLTDIQLYNAEHARTLFDVEGADVRYGYSVASNAALDLTKFEYRLVVDADPTLGVDNVTFTLQPDTGTGSPYKWVSEGGEYTISDDGGLSSVTQNIQQLNWLSGAFSAGDVHDITLQVLNRATGVTIGETAITLADIAEVTSGSLSLGDNNGTLFAGTGNPNEAFSIVTSGGVELGISGRYAQNIVPVVGEQEDGKVHYTMRDGTDVRFAYSIADTSGAANVFKLKIDVDGTSGTNFVEFIKIGASEADPWVRTGNGGNITDDGGTSSISQNIQNIAWYDADLTNSFLASGEYDVVLEAYRSDGVTLIAQNSVVFDVFTAG